MDAGREILRILRPLIILVERTPRSHFERLCDRDDLVKELTRIILQVKRRLAVGMHTLRILSSHFELPRDGGDLDILEKDSAGKIWKPAVALLGLLASLLFLEDGSFSFQTKCLQSNDQVVFCERITGASSA
ncbi:hypothetical protein SLA2020_493570 [Shorea laevis]